MRATELKRDPLLLFATKSNFAICPLAPLPSHRLKRSFDRERRFHTTHLCPVTRGDGQGEVLLAVLVLVLQQVDCCFLYLCCGTVGFGKLIGAMLMRLS